MSRAVLARLFRKKPTREQELEEIRRRRLDFDRDFGKLRQSLDREFQRAPQQQKLVMANIAAGSVLALFRVALQHQRQREEMRFSVRPTRDSDQGGLMARFLRHLALHLLHWRRSAKS